MLTLLEEHVGDGVESERGAVTCLVLKKPVGSHLAEVCHILNTYNVTVHKCLQVFIAFRQQVVGDVAISRRQRERSDVRLVRQVVQETACQHVDLLQGRTIS